VVRTPFLLTHAQLNPPRYWIRLPCQSFESISVMVPHFRLPHIPRRSAFRTFRRESALFVLRLGTHGTGLRVPLWLFPFARCRSVWNSWPKHELGLYDIVSCYQREYLQLILRHGLRQAQHYQARRGTGMYRRAGLLQKCVPGHNRGMLIRIRRQLV
jgi:hypothetical protein